jgi:hypothetical protein
LQAGFHNARLGLSGRASAVQINLGIVKMPPGKPRHHINWSIVAQIIACDHLLYANEHAARMIEGDLRF